VLSCLVRALAKAGKADQALALSRRTVESLKTTPYPRCRAEHDATVYSYLLGAAVREAEAQEARQAGDFQVDGHGAAANLRDREAPSERTGPFSLLT